MADSKYKLLNDVELYTADAVDEKLEAYDDAIAQAEADAAEALAAAEAVYDVADEAKTTAESAVETAQEAEAEASSVQSLAIQALASATTAANKVTALTNVCAQVTNDITTLADNVDDLISSYAFVYTVIPDEEDVLVDMYHALIAGTAVTWEHLCQINGSSGGSGGTWGTITGVLADQTDLQSALDAKADTDELAPVATSGNYNDLTNKPAAINKDILIDMSITKSNVIGKMLTNTEFDTAMINGTNTMAFFKGNKQKYRSHTDSLYNSSGVPVKINNDFAAIGTASFDFPVFSYDYAINQFGIIYNFGDATSATVGEILSHVREYQIKHRQFMALFSGMLMSEAIEAMTGDDDVDDILGLKEGFIFSGQFPAWHGTDGWSSSQAGLYYLGYSTEDNDYCIWEASTTGGSAPFYTKLGASTVIPSSAKVYMSLIFISSPDYYYAKNNTTGTLYTHSGGDDYLTESTEWQYWRSV